MDEGDARGGSLTHASADAAVDTKPDADGGGIDASLISLVLRGDKLPLRNAVSTCYNAVTQQLLVVTAPALFLYGHLLELGGELLGVIAADGNVQFQSAIVLSWIHAYSVIATNHTGHIEHRLISDDLSECHLTHMIAERGTFYTAISNPIRHEVITTDSDGGLKVWVLRSAGTPHNSKAPLTWRGFQRVHAGGRKTCYTHLILACDDQSILACTKTRIHVFDSTTCARLGTLYRDASCAIERVSYDRERNIVYLLIDKSRSRLVYRFQGSLLRGRMHALGAVGVCGVGEDIMAFEAITQDNLSANTAPQGDGIFALNAVGKLSVDSCSASGESQFVGGCSINLPLAPTTEAYVAIHLQTQHSELRTFAVVVSSSGLVVVEAMLANSIALTRRVVTNVAATKVTMVEVDEQRRIAIFNATPPSILLFDDDKANMMCAILLPIPLHDKDENQLPDNSVVDFTAVRSGVVAVWTSGDVTHYCLQTKRTNLVGRIHGMPAIIESTASSQDEFVFVGDDVGAITLWIFQQESKIVHVGTKNVHNQRILSICTVHAEPSDASVFLVTVAIDGDVKFWRLWQLQDLDVAWDLLVCFRTYATILSATALMGTEYLFCGSDEGGFECWRLPDITLAKSLDSRSGRGHVAVLKRPLHSIDLHLTRICKVIIEPGRDVAKRVSTAHPLLDEFAWVITYDMDQIVLIWCFSPTFLFPHRKLRPHTLPIGGFLSAFNESTYHFYAYLGRCLDRVDVAGEIDRVAVKHRLVKARQSEIWTTNMIPHTAIHNSETHRNENRMRVESEADSLVARLRLRITLPSVTQVDALAELDAPRRTSPLKLPKTAITKRDREDIPQETMESDASALEEPNPNQALWSEGCALSPTRMLSKAAPRSVSQGEKRQLRNALARQSVRASSFAPDTVPSQFQKAKPRLYRSSVHSVVTNSNQSRPSAAVVTSMIGSTDFDHSASVASNTTGRGSQNHHQREGDIQQHQDRVAIVSVAEEEMDGHLRLDFQASGSTRRKSAKQSGKQTTEIGEFATVHYIPWSSLQSEHQLVELTAATRSRLVVQGAFEDKITIPTQNDFASGDVKAQLTIRAFSRWYLSGTQSYQRIRGLFLREELHFAARDAFVNMAMTNSGCLVPPPADIGDDTSPHWIRFTVWYATGNLYFGGAALPTVEVPKRLADRLQERTSFLKKRLETIGPVPSPDNGPYIFDATHFASASNGGIDVASWAQQSDECRQRELLLALDDPMVQVAAISDEVELSDMTMVNLHDIDICSFAPSFASWWARPSNVYRHEFVNQELAEAARDERVRESLNRGGGEQDAATFREAYFQSSPTRETFLTQKLACKQRLKRIDTIFRSGKHSAPILFEAFQVSLLVPFSFPSVRAASSEASAEIVLAEEILEHQSDLLEKETARSQLTPDAPQQHVHDFDRRFEELALMAFEDALSREHNDLYDSGSDDDRDVEQMPIEPPKRKDFTNLYFFGNLPKTFRINAGGWIAGSGLDNGDEEAEEEERLEKERQRQEMLDRLEAERIAEAERQAERMRLEKEMDEKALQMKRLRQVELRKILAHQAELEAQRMEQDAHLARVLERAAMEAEERHMKAWIQCVEMERAAMIREDRLAAEAALAERHARRNEIRRVLSEMTQMDAEDRWSALTQAEQLERERQEQLRVKYLTELYEPFEPFFPESRTPSEEMLPIITRRPKRRVSRLQKQDGYTLPTAEMLVLDSDVEQEQYAVRESRKLRQLLGLPLNTPQSRRMMRIPSESDIIKTRQDLLRMLPPTVSGEEDRLDALGMSEVEFSDTRKTLTSQQAERQKNKARLPELAQWKAQRGERLTDLTQVAPSPTKSNQHKAKAKPLVDQPARQQTALPFFRGNFLVEGTRPRSQAYVRK